MDPIVSVGAVVIDNEELLLIRRGHGPAAGEWSIPGGRVDAGELLEEALVREVHEETALEVVSTGFLDWTELIDENSHFVVLDFNCQLIGNREPTAGDDAAEARWVSIRDVGEMNLVPGLAEFLHENGVIPTIA
jgi:8-oxo-dGTP diphosphatase